MRLVLMILLAGITLATLVTGSPDSQAAPKPVFRAGAAAVKITPSLTRPVFIAGYDSNRIAESVHDDLWARVLVLDDGRTRTAVVSCDLIGLFNSRVRKIRAAIGARGGVPAENVLITCTHVHSGPDTMGLWGKAPLSSGLDPLYMKRLEDRIVVGVDAAVRDLQPVTLSAGKVTVPDGFVHNSREELQDKELTALRLTSSTGRTVATVIHYGGHPEVNKSKALTSDYVHYVREGVERQFGGVALYLNGALGGMVTPKVKGHTLEEMERVGKGVAKSAVEAVERAKAVEVDTITLRRKDVTLPLANDQFRLLLAAKVLDNDTRVDQGVAQFETEVWRVDLGPITWITIPGEILPRPALELKKAMPGRFPMVVALGNDELGYILDPEDFGKDRYKYERSMSVGKETWPRLWSAAKELLK